jgi:DNA-binding MarR family transcriptional regulator
MPGKEPGGAGAGTGTAAADEVVDAVLRGSRALVAIAARSLADADRAVTLPQYRVLVVLASRGPATAGALADALGVHRSTLTRMCDRLVAKRLVTRAESATSRREITISLTARGRALVDSVTERRRHDIARVIERVPVAERTPMVDALHALGDAAGEPADAAWPMGWVAE